MQKKGRIEVITGCMFSGKSEELIRRIRRVEIAKQRVVVFNSCLDKRYIKEGIASHSGYQAAAIAIQKSKEILLKVKNNIQVVAIDEVQFFDEDIVDVVDALVEKGLRVIVVGLDLDFRGEPFVPMSLILAKAEQVDKLTAICLVCGQEATMTQRLIDGQPVSYNDLTIVVGAEESYEARCRTCHIILDKPVKK